MATTWTKLRSGRWGARQVGGEKPRVAQLREVTARSGKVSVVVVLDVVWSGADRTTGEPVHLLSVEKVDPAKAEAVASKWAEEKGEDLFAGSPTPIVA